MPLPVPKGMQMYLEPLAIILLVATGSIVGLLIAYWVIRLAVRPGIEDARRREARPPAAGYWDPARVGSPSGGSAPAGR